MISRFLAAGAAASVLCLGASNVRAHDGLGLHATDVLETGAGIVVETGIGLSTRDGSAWSIVCVDALATSTEVVRRVAFLGSDTIAVVRDASVGIASRACGAGAARLTVGGRILASTSAGGSLRLIVGDDTIGTALVSVDVAGTRARELLPTPLSSPDVIAFGGGVCAIGTANERARIECLVDGRWSDRELGAGGAMIALAAGPSVLFLARRTAPLEPDTVIAVGDDVIEHVLPGVEKARGAALVGDRLYVAARPIAGSGAAQGTLHALDPGSLAAVAEPVAGPPFECLREIGGSLFACVDRGIDPEGTSVMVSDDAVSFRKYFSFDDVGSLEACGGASCAATRLALCRASGRFCTSESATPDATPDEPTSESCSYGARATVTSAPASLLAIAWLRRRRRSRS